MLKRCIWQVSAFQWEAKLREMKGQWSVTEDQVDLLAVERVVGALGYGLPGDLLTREGDQGLAAALATEVVQDENGVWLELQRKKKKKRGRQTVSLVLMQLYWENTRGSPQA